VRERVYVCVTIWQKNQKQIHVSEKLLTLLDEHKVTGPSNTVTECIDIRLLEPNLVKNFKPAKESLHSDGSSRKTRDEAKRDDAEDVQGKNLSDGRCRGRFIKAFKNSLP
jgi:hypothetical protein